MEGKGVIHINGEEENVQSVKLFIYHQITSMDSKYGRDELKFLCIVAPPWNEDDEELVDK